MHRLERCIEAAGSSTIDASRAAPLSTSAWTGTGIARIFSVSKRGHRAFTMQAVLESYTLLGIEAVPVEVQVSVDNGYPITTIVGLPDKSVRESLDRIQAAFHSSGFGVADRKVTVNLAPAELRKEGAAFDLAIALGIQAALGAFPASALEGLSVAGELALNGQVRPVRGALAMSLAAARSGRTMLLLPEANLQEAREVPGLAVRPLRSLAETVVGLRNGGWEDAPGWRAEADAELGAPLVPEAPESSESLDLSRVRGQAAALRALEIAAAGGHNLLFCGPPGSGKTLLAQSLPGILPPLNREESLEVTLIHSVAGLLPDRVGRISRRPFRAPHHTVTGPGLVGGGAIPRPGEVSLSHRGVLFLDELPEFRPQILNLLRQPLEEGRVRLVRAGRTVEFPCQFMLVGAMNPCPCGFLGHPRRPCRCTPRQVQLYKARLSGPLLDRIDMHVEVPAVAARELTRGVRRRRGVAEDSRNRSPEAGSLAGEPEPESSAAVRARVVAARRVQETRLTGEPIHCNAQMGIREIEQHCRVDDATRALLHKAMETRSMSARAAHRVLRVARTIADLAGLEEIALEHVAEAVQYQTPDREDEGG